MRSLRIRSRARMMLARRTGGWTRERAQADAGQAQTLGFRARGETIPWAAFAALCAMQHFHPGVEVEEGGVEVVRRISPTWYAVGSRQIGEIPQVESMR